MEVPDSTLADVGRRSAGAPGVWGRRAFLLVLAVVLLAGVTGLLGVRSTTSSASAGGYELSVRHAAVARAGLDVPWEVTVERAGGFDEQLLLAVTGDYFDIYETQGFLPEPARTTRDADTLYLTFDAPEGEIFHLSYDAYIQPSSQQGRDGSVSVLVTGGQPAVTVDFDTRLLP